MPTEYFEQRERALLGQRYEQLYAAPQQTAERGVTVSALRTTALAVSLATLAMGNVAFLLYDRAIHNLLQLYRLVWQPKLHKMLGR